jgi:hypothetical protein
VTHLAWLNAVVLTERAAVDLVETLELDEIPVCVMCLFDLAWAMHSSSRSHHGLLRSTCSWVWPEIADAVHVAVVRARMREIEHADEALLDMSEHGHRGVFATRVVSTLARRLTDEFQFI